MELRNVAISVALGMAIIAVGVALVIGLNFVFVGTLVGTAAGVGRTAQIGGLWDAATRR